MIDFRHSGVQLLILLFKTIISGAKLHTCMLISEQVYLNLKHHITIWENSADEMIFVVVFFFCCFFFFAVFVFFFSKTGFDISCKSTPLETICMKCQIQFPGTNKKNISKCFPLKHFIHRAKH